MKKTEVMRAILNSPYYQLLKTIQNDQVRTHPLDLKINFAKRGKEDTIVITISTNNFLYFDEYEVNLFKEDSADRIMKSIVLYIMVRGLFVEDSTKYRRELKESLSKFM